MSGSKQPLYRFIEVIIFEFVERGLAPSKTRALQTQNHANGRSKGRR
jgi:hypothetical protein